MAAKREVLYTIAIITDTNVVPKPKYGYKASRICTTSTDSGRHHLLNIEDGGQ